MEWDQKLYYVHWFSGRQKVFVSFEDFQRKFMILNQFHFNCLVIGSSKVGNQWEATFYNLWLIRLIHQRLLIKLFPQDWNQPPHPPQSILPWHSLVIGGGEEDGRVLLVFFIILLFIISSLNYFYDTEPILFQLTYHWFI